MYRYIAQRIEQLQNQKKPPMVLILGMRQVGKSTLAKSVCEGKNYTAFNFDLLSDISEFSEKNRHELGLFAKKYQGNIIIIDEIQKSPSAVGVVKYLYDTYNMPFILTGSSEIKIRRGIGDSLAGRVRETKLYPLSLEEINVQNGLKFDWGKEFNNYEYNQGQLLKYLVFGSLPQLQNIPVHEYVNYLKGLTNTILSKDILEVAGVRKPVQVYHLAKLLAYQIGQIVNVNELAQETNLSRISVVNFIEIFEQMGIVTKVNPISARMRESIVNRSKIYFNDLGVRNCLIDDFSDFNTRPDKGFLLENAVFMGFKRKLEYGENSYQLGFFRSKYGGEIDIVKVEGGKEELYEVKVKHSSKKIKENVSVITFDSAQKYIY